MRDLILIAIVVSCSLIALRRPVFGFLTFACLGFLNPHSMMWGIGQTFRHSMLVGFTTLVGYLFWSERKKFPLQRETFLLLGLWIMFGVSTFFAIYPEKASPKFTYISKVLLMVFLSTSLINNEQRLRSLIRVIALSLGFFGLKGGIFVILSGGSYVVWGPEESFLAANNSIGLAMVMNVPLLLYLLEVETHQRLRWLLKAMLLFSYPAVVATYSRGAWLGLATVTALAVLRSKKRGLIITVTAILVMMALPYLPVLIPERLSNRYEDLRNFKTDESANARLWSWEFCKRVGLAHPVAGGGFDFYSLETYGIYYPEFVEYFSKLGKVLAWSCHSVWFTVLGEHGVTGFLLWLGLIGSCFLSLRRVRLYGIAHPEMSWVTHLSDMLMISFASFMLVGTFLDAAYFDMFYYLVAMVIILKELLHQDAAEASARATVSGANRFSLQAAR